MFLAGMDGQRERAAGFPRKLRRGELERIDGTEADTEAASRGTAPRPGRCRSARTRGASWRS
ncbi:MAG TPA: hypothetical protein VFY48_11735 [Solirubrobacterales bacterium]|nr:hypothetical protein [Solirubrobacterales bacterium]